MTFKWSKMCSDLLLSDIRGVKNIASRKGDMYDLVRPYGHVMHVVVGSDRAHGGGGRCVLSAF